ncbi:MAG: PAS domain-containing sensor histidine kinase, partial [Bacillota bacterium]|nr:PAS domain-containing sensor histidine kinase [Bacillota bacterium]
MIFKSIVGKLWSALVVFLLVTFIILGFVLSEMMENFYLNLRANELIHHGNQLALTIGEQNEPEKVFNNIDLISTTINANILILDRRGLVQASSGLMNLSPGVRFESPDLDRVTKGDTIIRKGTHSLFNMSMMSVAVPISHNRQIIGGIFIDAPLAPMAQTVEHIREIILLAATATIVVATILSFFLSRSISSPLIAMNDAALAMAKG